jgi:hypothetical protein
MKIEESGHHQELTHQILPLVYVSPKILKKDKKGK